VNPPSERAPSWPPPVPVLHGSHDTLQAGDIDIDRTAHLVRIRGEQVSLPLREYQLLELLVANAGTALTRDEIIRRIWGDDPASNSLDVHIRRLRSKIETNPAHPQRLHTIRGLGYRLDATSADPAGTRHRAEPPNATTAASP
jgi:DNA-binding response OmpR family regulator